MPTSIEVLHLGRCVNERTLTQLTKIAHNRPVVRRQCLDVLLTYITDNRSQQHHSVLIPRHRLTTHRFTE